MGGGGSSKDSSERVWEQVEDWAYSTVGTLRCIAVTHAAFDGSRRVGVSLSGASGTSRSVHVEATSLSGHLHDDPNLSDASPGPLSSCPFAQPTRGAAPRVPATKTQHPIGDVYPPVLRPS